MPLSKEQIAEFDKITGNTTPSVHPSVSDTSEIDAAITKANGGVSPSSMVEHGTPTGVSTVNNIVSDLKKRGENISNSISDASKNINNYQNPFVSPTDTSVASPSDLSAGSAANAVAETGKTVAHSIGQLGAGVGDIFLNIFKGVKDSIPEDIKQSAGYQDLARVIKDTFDYNNLSTEQKQALADLGEAAKNNPEVTAALTDALDSTGLLVPAASKAITAPVKEAASAATDLATSGVNTAKEAISGVVNTAKESLPTIAKDSEKIFKNNIDEARKILNPEGKISIKDKQSMLGTTDIQTSGKSIFKKDLVNPKVTPEDELLGQLVNDNIISTKKTLSENISAVRQEARKYDANIDEIVSRPELNKPFNKKTIEKVFDTVVNSAKKDLVFVPDTTEEKAYRAVIDVAKEEIANNSLNNSGLRKATKAFNARMERILGKDIYEGSNEAVSKARVQAAKDVRRELNNFLADNLESAPIKTDKVLAGEKVVNKLPAKSEYGLGKTQAGSVYKSQLQKEAQLLNAADEAAFNGRTSVGKSKARIFFDAHPVLKETLKAAGGTVGGISVYKALFGN